MLRNIWNQVTDIWAGMSAGQRVAVLAVSVTMFVTLTVVSFVASRPKYELLYSNLDQAEAGEIVAKLQELSVPFRMGQGGATIEVVGSVGTVKAQLANAGIAPDRDIGYAEMFDGAKGFGRTDREMTLAETRGLSGELSRRLSQQPYLHDADVMIARPEPSLFVHEKKPVTASVTVWPRRPLSERQVFGIASLVASAVSELEINNVTIVDERGVMLSRAQSEMGQFGASNQFDVQSELETRLAWRAMQQLSVLVGESKASVQVTARLDFKREAETVETIDGEQKPMREKVSTTKRTGASPGGATGIDAALAGTSDGGSPMKEDTEDIETDYLYGKTRKTTESNGAKILRLTVSVVAARSAAEELAGDAGGATPDEKLATAKSAIENIVRDAVGFEEGRDTISIAFSDKFVEPIEEPKAAGLPLGLSELTKDDVFQIVETVGALLVVVVLFFMIRPVLRRSVSSVVPPDPVLVAGGGGAGAIDGGDGTPQLAAPADAPALSAAAQLSELVENDPEKVAKIMKNWVAKEEV